jgi:hypothetical protein
MRVVNSQGQVVGNQVASIPRLAVRRNIPAEQQPIKRLPPRQWLRSMTVIRRTGNARNSFVGFPFPL